MGEVGLRDLEPTDNGAGLESKLGLSQEASSAQPRSLGAQGSHRQVLNREEGCPAFS